MGILGICKIHSFLKKCFFIPNSNKFSIQNNPPMHSRLTFHKTLIKAKSKSGNFEVIDLLVFQQLIKL